jgi:tetratricopeptide (TPR) repeat protein
MIKFLVTIIILIMNNNSFAHGQTSNLITPVSYFVDHVKQLKSTQEGLKKYRQTSIIGTSGIGKTQLVRTYAYDNRDNYNIIWFFDCNLDLNEEFVKLAKKLNGIKKNNISEDVVLSKKEVMDHLFHEDQWLLVFDNLKINENKKVQDLVDWEHNGNVIFCSQDGKELPNTIEMTSFGNSDSIALARNLLQNKDQDDVEFLVKAFNGYPILIVQGAQLLNQVKGLNKEEYKKKIYQSADKIKLNIELAIKELTPSATKLLNKIALINNQSFSKQILNIIADNTNTIDDDIFQLSKFVLISNTDPSENNPIFEMHDIIAQKITEMNGDQKNKDNLEDIVDKITKALPATMHSGHIFRNGKTVSDNLRIIAGHQQRYNLSIYKLLPLNSSLLTDYINTLQYYEVEKILSWFNELDKKNMFKLRLMDNDTQYFYSRIFSNIGGYYKHRFADWNKALGYYLKANQVLEKVTGYQAIKCNVFYNLANVYISLGQMNEAQKEINKMQEMFDSGVVDIQEIGMLHLIKAKFYHYNGNEDKALEESDKDIIETSKTGIKLNDLFFTVSYVLRADILNSLGKYNEAYNQARQLYEMHKSTKNESHEIFGRIYTQLAKSELGLEKIDEALKHVREAIAIFLADDLRNPKEADYSEDTDLAASYVVQGDIYQVQDNLKQAIESYKKAQVIYFYLYRDRSKDLPHVSYLYTQGAKAACKAKDLYNYKTFGKPQVKEFGIGHPNTIAMFKYCKQHDMDLWAKEN